MAVGQEDPRRQYYRNLALGLGTKDKPSWTLPEHTYYADANDLDRIIRQVQRDIADAGADGQVRVLPGIRLLRRDAASLLERGKIIRDADIPGYWMYELADLTAAKKPIEFEGSLIEPVEKYVRALAAMNEQLQR